MNKSYDFIIIGAGVVGLTIAREMLQQGYSNICVLEKEPHLGAHSSGRNSGVLHAGIYYPAKSQKAKVCVEGARLLRDYAREKGLSFSECGKVIVTTSEEQLNQLDFLYKQARENGVEIQSVDVKELAEIEPAAQTVERALFSPKTAVFDPKSILKQLAEDLVAQGVHIEYNATVVNIDTSQKQVSTTTQKIGYNHLVNAAGLYADRIAHKMGVAKNYRILPFRGRYRKLSMESAQKVERHIYPVPDLNLPFLGVHLTKSYNGDVTVGPTAFPAMGRENYSGLSGVHWLELPAIATHLTKMVATNQNNMYNHIWSELKKLSNSHLISEMKKMTSSLPSMELLPSPKVGLRAQLIELPSCKLIMDFKIASGPDSTHILNAVSPAFSASFSFAREVLNYISSPS